MKTLLSIAFVMAFTASTAHATHVGTGFKNEFESWGNTIENWWDDGGQLNRLIEDLDEIGSLGVITPAHATHVGAGFKSEFESWGNTIENWWDDGGQLNRLIEDLEEVEGAR
ncbi:MAG: hypothetical protein V6Z81_03355 [Parvularculales bacterium]